MTRNCDVCGRQYEAMRRSSRFCGDTCRKRDLRASRPRPAETVDYALVDATRAELEAAGCIDTWRGRGLLSLARGHVRPPDGRRDGRAVAGVSARQGRGTAGRAGACRSGRRAAAPAGPEARAAALVMTAAQEYSGEPLVFCRRCKRMLPRGQFYVGNLSTCRACKVQRAADRRAADPVATAEARRAERARARLRAEASTRMLQHVLTAAAPIWEALCRDDSLDVAAVLVVADARSCWYELLAEAIHELEDELGLDPGTGLQALTRTVHRREQFHGTPGIPSVGRRSTP
jgi:hypothetical protein